VKSIRYKSSVFKLLVVVFAVDFIILNYLGMHKPNPERTMVARIGTIYYFFFFLGMPIYSRILGTKPEPQRVTA
jgi:ubiquinol-cytochrome c reductase cytochrome b subunit